MENKINRSLMDIVNTIKRYKVWLKFWYFVLTFPRNNFKMFSEKREQIIGILIEFHIFWFYS